MFQNIGFKMFQTMCFFLCAQNVSPGIRSLFVEPVLKHDWANRLRRHPATSNAIGSTQALSARKKTSKTNVENANHGAKLSEKTCHITKIKRSHRNGGFKNVDANSKITYL